MAAGLARSAEVSDMAGQQPGAAPSGAQGPVLQRADGTPIRVLVVDDEPSLAELLASVLRYEGWEIRTAGDGTSAVRTAREFRPDAVVLDIMLPDFDGLEVLRRVRADLPHVCVLFLTARDAVEDRVAGITAGGDDYVTKPFSLEEVLARLRGLLRRAGITRSRSATQLTVGDLTMDEEAREVRPGGRGRAVHQLPAQEDRLRPAAADPHGPRRRLRPQAARLASAMRRSSLAEMPQAPGRTPHKALQAPLRCPGGE